MNIRNIRKALIQHPHTLALETLSKVDTRHLCDESLLCFFHLVLDSIPSKALEAALILDAVKLPRRGRVVDESGGYLTERASRIAKARNF